MSEYANKYYAEHKEKLSAVQRKWRKDHPEAQAKRSKLRRDAWMDIIKARGMDRCSKCGYDKCFAAIDFHHLDPKEKKDRIARLIRLPLTDERLAELNKTIALCKNCHMELHYCE